jgi:hypothetical protein
MKAIQTIIYASCLLLSFSAYSQEQQPASSTNIDAQAEAKSNQESVLAAQEKAAAATGLDPTQVIGRVEFNYSYTEQQNGTKRHSGILGIDKDISKTTVIGIKVPLSTAELANGDEQNGIGDIQLQIRKLAFVKGKFITSFGAGVTLDTASEDQLGNNSNSVGAGMFNAWKHGEWLVATISAVNFSEDDNYNSISLSPMVAYQPMGDYVSYVRTALSYVYRTESEQSITNAFINIGKVMPNKDVYSIGTKLNISGPDDDDFVVLLKYRRLL